MDKVTSAKPRARLVEKSSALGVLVLVPTEGNT